jgi:hypothetical protein
MEREWEYGLEPRISRMGTDDFLNGRGFGEPQMSRMDADDFGELGGAAMIEGAAGRGWGSRRVCGGLGPRVGTGRC